MTIKTKDIVSKEILTTREAAAVVSLYRGSKVWLDLDLQGTSGTPGSICSGCKRDLLFRSVRKHL